MALSSTLSNLVLLAVLCVSAHGTYYPSVVYLSEYCGTTMTVQGDLRVKLSSTLYLNPNSECRLTLLPSQGNTRLVAKFVSYSMNPGYISYSDNCQVESIQLQTPNRRFFGHRGYCGVSRPTNSYDLGTSATFSYMTWGFSQILTADVDLLFAEVHLKDSAGSCPDNTFDCHRQNYCIDEDMTCNGYNDCGNNRDEIEGCGLTPGIIGAIVGGIIAFILIVAIVSFISYRIVRRRKLYVQFG